MSRIRKRRLMNQINVVPYIDVTLVLLVIFMVTAPLTNPGVIDLPSVGQSLKPPSAPLVIKVKPDGTAAIEDKVMPRDQLLFEVRNQLKKDPERSMVVAGDEKVPYGKVVEVLDILSQAGVKRPGLLAKPAAK